MNRRATEPYGRWCERELGGDPAPYSIFELLVSTAKTSRTGTSSRYACKGSLNLILATSLLFF